jgi:hypothetical protein
MAENTKTISPDAVKCISSEASAPDECGGNPTTVASTQLNGRNQIVSVNLLIPTPGLQDNPSNQHYEITVAATSEDQQVNLLTKSYLVRLNVPDDSQDDDQEEYERGDDDSGFPSAIQEIVYN